MNIEQLNAIPGRPSELEWHPIADGTAFELDRTDTGHWFIRVKADGTAMKFYLSTYPATPTELLAFATYIRRVEVEIERWSKGFLYTYGDDRCAQDNENDVIEDYISEISELDLEDGCCEIELTLCKPTPISAMLPSMKVITDVMEENIYSAMSDADDNDVVEVLDGAEEALNIWADTYLRYRRGFPCENEGEKIVKVRVSESGWEVIE